MSRGGFNVRAGQREFERGVLKHRVCALLARRQYGKTTIASRIALKKMMKRAGHTVVFGTVKLDLGREMTRKEAEQLQRAFRLMAEQAASGKMLLQAVDSSKAIKGTERAQEFSAEEWADLYEQTKLELRLYHSRSVYSRTKVVALTPDAVGETGDLILDEVGRVKKFRDVAEAVMPIIASNPEFRCIYTTTPPPDDAHYSFELLAPPIGAEMPISPAGNWYKSDLGVWVLRITAEDAYADGVPLYDDDTGVSLSPAESRVKANDKDAWDRNYGCAFKMGGTAAVNLLALDTAQRRGIGSCYLAQIDSDTDFDRAVNLLPGRMGPGTVGLGWDLATTTKALSNPSAFGVLEEGGNDLILRAVFLWKTADPDLAVERARRIVQAVAMRKEGGRARRLAVDATNERYFAASARKALMDLVPVELVVGSDKAEAPGEEESITMKQYTCGQFISELEDNHLTLPPERYLREDFRLVRKERGQFICEPDAQGRHGDTFDCGRFGLRALRSKGGALSSTSGIYLGGGGKTRGTVVRKFRPRRLT